MTEITNLLTGLYSLHEVDSSSGTNFASQSSGETDDVTGEVEQVDGNMDRSK